MNLIPIKKNLTLTYEECLAIKKKVDKQKELSSIREYVRKMKRRLPIETNVEANNEFPKFVGNGWMYEMQPEDENLFEKDLEAEVIVIR